MRDDDPIEQAWQEIAIRMDLDSTHCGWFHGWFRRKLDARVEAILTRIKELEVANGDYDVLIAAIRAAFPKEG